MCERESKGCDRILGVGGGGLVAYVTIRSMVFIKKNAQSFLLNTTRS